MSNINQIGFQSPVSQAFKALNPALQNLLCARPQLMHHCCWMPGHQLAQVLQGILPLPQPQPQPAQTGLEVNGNVIDAGRYEVHVSKGEVKVLDTETGKFVRAWGDPHLHTSDGDKAQFHTDNVTIDLPDGTKVTITPTEKNAQGIALVDQVAVMKGDEAVMAVNISTAPVMGTVTDNAAAVDAFHADGTVLQVRGDIDDLFFAATGVELLGLDHSQRWNEHMLDGVGGTSQYDFTNPSPADLPNILDRFQDFLAERFPDVFRPSRPGNAGGSEAAEGAGGADASEGASSPSRTDNSGLDPMTRLLLILQKVDDQLRDKLDSLEELTDKKARLEELGKKENLTGAEQTELTALKAEGIDGKLEVVTQEVQLVMQLKQQFSQMMTNLSKSDHDAKMATIRNMRA